MLAGDAETDIHRELNSIKSSRFKKLSKLMSGLMQWEKCKEFYDRASHDLFIIVESTRRYDDDDDIKSQMKSASHELLT